MQNAPKVGFRVALQVVEQLPQTDGAQVEGLQVCLLDQVRPVHQALEVVAVSQIEDVAELMSGGLQGTVKLQIQLLIFTYRSVLWGIRFREIGVMTGRADQTYPRLDLSHPKYYCLCLEINLTETPSVSWK